MKLLGYSLVNCKNHSYRFFCHSQCLPPKHDLPISPQNGCFDVLTDLLICLLTDKVSVDYITPLVIISVAFSCQSGWIPVDKGESIVMNYTACYILDFWLQFLFWF